VHEIWPAVPAVPDSLADVRLSVTWSPVRLTLMPEALSDAERVGSSEPPQAASPASREAAAKDESTRRGPIYPA
jgi:hypothetical protein